MSEWSARLHTELVRLHLGHTEVEQLSVEEDLELLKELGLGGAARSVGPSQHDVPLLVEDHVAGARVGH